MRHVIYDRPLVTEVKRRLDVFVAPSFDRDTVEKLVRQIELLEMSQKALLHKLERVKSVSTSRLRRAQES